MSTLKSFEKIDAWIAARELCTLIHSILKDKKWHDLAGIKDQIYRSSGSVMDNIAEGFERDHNNEYIYFLYVAKASCAEVKSQVYRLYDFGLITKDCFKELICQTAKTSELIGGFIRYIKTSGYEGQRKK